MERREFVNCGFKYTLVARGPAASLLRALDATESLICNVALCPVTGMLEVLDCTVTIRNVQVEQS